MNTKSQYRSFHYDNESPTLNAELQKIGFEEIEVCKETDPERYETLQDELEELGFIQYQGQTRGYIAAQYVENALRRSKWASASANATAPFPVADLTYWRQIRRRRRINTTSRLTINIHRDAPVPRTQHLTISPRGFVRGSPVPEPLSLSKSFRSNGRLLYPLQDREIMSFDEIVEEVS
jgi:MoaA/NifB/PqqE/SkfB family radical SAM enzyme